MLLYSMAHTLKIISYKKETIKHKNKFLQQEQEIFKSFFVKKIFKGRQIEPDQLFTWENVIIHNTTALRDNFPRFACWGDLVFSKFQNPFRAWSAQPGQKCESWSMFNTKMSAVLWFRDCIIVTTIKIKSMLIWLINYFQWYTL